jgi:hypothetical protein
MNVEKVLSAAAVLLVVVGSSTAHAGKRLTTAPSGISELVECTLVNVSETKTLSVSIIRNAAGQVTTQSPNTSVPPLNRRGLISTGAHLWCEFVVDAGGSAKDLRASMVVYDEGAIAASDQAREK